MARYGSDLIADLLRVYDIPYAAINPGATFRGLHDSIVNYNGNRPEIIECPHEEIAVGIAHGYAKATGKPMAAIVHNVVGLLHACLPIYYAYIDRAPIMLFGATGPMAVGRRRPRLDWDHTAIVQGNAIRDYVKWDDNPLDAEAVVHSFSRGYRVARTEPQGPVYICYDVAFQEDELTTEVRLPDPARGGQHTRMAMDRAAMHSLVTRLLAARRPVIVADHAGRHPETVGQLVGLAEMLSARVVDLNGRMNFPNNHPLFASDNKAVQDADLLLALDVRDLNGFLAVVDEDDRPTGAKHIPAGCWVANISLEDLETSAWAQNSQRYEEVDLSVLADTATAVPEIAEELRQRLGEAAPESAIAHRQERMAGFAVRHAERRARWLAEAMSNPDASPMTAARMVLEVGKAIQGHDWVLTANTVRDWARRLWDFDQPYRHPGRSLGTATQIGISLGIALAYRGTGKLVVDLQPDGDLMYDAGALWVAAHHKLPMLVVMYNNRAYYNSWNHQDKVAKRRGRDRTNVRVGTEIDGPAPDFAGLARSMGWWAEGPVLTGDALGGALGRAVRVVKEDGRPALVDAVTMPR
jgi:thiamine pyrophosphate-dependent acetolactate synthase large subunit-like protein